MFRATRRAMILLTLMGLPQSVMAGSVTYNIVNYPNLQNGWTLSGTITTDGAIGGLRSSDITAWTLTMTKGSSSYTGTSIDPFVSLSVIGVIATPTEIYLPSPT